MGKLGLKELSEARLCATMPRKLAEVGLWKMEWVLLAENDEVSMRRTSKLAGIDEVGRNVGGSRSRGLAGEFLAG